MIDARIDLAMQLREPNEPMPRFETALVPRNSISGRALVAVVAIMTFLGSLTTGAAVLVTKAAGEWQSDISREMTIQIMPAPGRDLDASVNRAVAITRAISGVTEVRPYSKEESMKLLEPWLGSGISLSELPVPRLIVIKTAADATPDLGLLRRTLADQVPGAVVDDHRGWIDRMRAMAGTAIAAGVCILILMFAATILSVAFATRGAMATNKAVIEVLHFVGAKNGFIARHFQHHFLVLGLQGGAIGGGAAIVMFLAAAMISHWLVGGDQGSALFGSFSIGLLGYAAVLGQVLLIAIVTAWTSRHTVNSTLETID
jgi:cell division transport system permease protein